jgi:hypothetical protein
VIGVGVGVGINAGQASTGYIYTNAESSALVARMTTPPTSARAALIDTLIGSLKSSGVWAKCDAIYLFAAADSQAACLNWKGSSYTATPTSSPTFTADRGFTGNGSSAYLDTGAAHNGLTNLTLNSAHLSAWCLTELNLATSLSAGLTGTTNTLYVAPRALGLAGGRIDDFVTLQVTQASSIGLTGLNRSASGARQLYRNGASIGSDAQASSALQAANIVFLRGTTQYGAHQVSFGSFGASLSGTEEAAKYSAVLAYLQGVGAA